MLLHSLWQMPAVPRNKTRQEGTKSAGAGVNMSSPGLFPQNVTPFRDIDSFKKESAGRKIICGESLTNVYYE